MKPDTPTPRSAYIVSLLTPFLLVLAVGLAILVTSCEKPERPRPGFYKVVSGSMEPTVHVGQIVVVTAQPIYKVGDVVLVDSPNYPAPVLHRIVAIGPQWAMTKGDANESPDPGITINQIVGKATY